MEQVRNILGEYYGIEANSVMKLPGEVSSNYLIQSGDQYYIFKDTPSDPSAEALIREENAILVQLALSLPGEFPEPVSRQDGFGKRRYHVLNPEGGHLYRLLSYLEGELLAQTKHTKELFMSFGNLLGRMDRELLKLSLPVIEARRYHWDILHFDLAYEHAQMLDDAGIRKLVDHFHLQFHEKVISALPRLRYSLIHSDANDYNVLVREGRVSGIIDFGDTVHSLLINEVAIALSYVLADKQEPLEWAAALIEGYCRILPLEEKEVEILYYLVAARASISLCHSARGRKENPDNDYLGISEMQMRELLRRWIRINPRAAEDAFRRAANLPACIKPEQEARSDVESEVEKRWNLLSKAFSLSYQEPIQMEAAVFQYMYDKNGATYLDLRNNIPHVGHCHPRVVKAGQRAMAKLNTNTRYLYEEILIYSEKLLSYFPPDLNKVFYVNSGSAASDLALRLARTHSGRQKMLVMEHAYHGNTAAVIDVSHYKFAGKGGKGTPPDTLVAPLPGTLNGLREHLNRFGEQPLAGFICEPIVSAGGQIVIEPEYMKELASFARKNGGLVISDEVQLGFGRLGKYFWAFEYSGMEPDIVILGKPIANGHPMAAVVCTAAIAESFHNGMEFFSSFGGNPVSCAIATAVLEVIEEEDLAGNAEETGNYLVRLLTELREEGGALGRHIGKIRGMGLSLGVEIVNDSTGSEPATKLAGKWVNALRQAHILVGTDGPHDNVLKIKPPLCFDRSDADIFISNLRMIAEGIT